MTAPMNVPSDCPTEKYRGAVGTPVQSDPNATFGGRGIVRSNESSTLGATGTPVKND